LAPVERERHGRYRDSDIFRQLFEGVVKACMVAGLVKGEGFAINASVMEAEASRYHGKFIGARSDSKLMSKSKN
jgi:transposase